MARREARRTRRTRRRARFSCGLPCCHGALPNPRRPGFVLPSRVRPPHRTRRSARHARGVGLSWSSGRHLSGLLGGVPYRMPMHELRRMAPVLLVVRTLRRASLRCVSRWRLLRMLRAFRVSGSHGPPSCFPSVPIFFSLAKGKRTKKLRSARRQPDAKTNKRHGTRQRNF